MILMYHKVDLTSPTMWWVDVASFYRHMCSLSDKKVVYLDDYDPANDDQVVITFDGVYSNVLDYAAPILAHFGYPFELFVSSDWIGLDNQFDRIEPPAKFADHDELRKLVSMGGRLQWHTRSHPALTMNRASANWSIVEAELEIPDDVRQLDQSGFDWFAYPYGNFSDDVVDAVRRKFRGALSCDQGCDSDRFKMNRVTALNAPLPSAKSVCVIVVSYNYGAYLAEAVESVLSQTVLPDSILIVDDASTDNSDEIGGKYASLYPDFVSFTRNDQNLGIVGTFNKAVSMSDSDYICILGADNRLSSNYIEMSLRGMLVEKVDIAYTNFRLFGERAHEEYLQHESERQGRIIDDQYYEIIFPKFSISNLLQGNFIHGSAMYSRRAFDSVEGYKDRRPGKPEDANLFRRMLVSGFKAAKVDDAWLEYRQHSPSQANMISKLQAEVEFLRVYSKRLEMKTKALGVAFGILSPIVRVLSSIEARIFNSLLKVARAWRRLTR